MVCYLPDKLKWLMDTLPPAFILTM
jgi:hypothetical protein